MYYTLLTAWFIFWIVSLTTIAVAVGAILALVFFFDIVAPQIFKYLWVQLDLSLTSVLNTLISDTVLQWCGSQLCWSHTRWCASMCSWRGILEGSFLPLQTGYFYHLTVWKDTRVQIYNYISHAGMVSIGTYTSCSFTMQLWVLWEPLFEYFSHCYLEHFYCSDWTRISWCVVSSLLTGVCC